MGSLWRVVTVTVVNGNVTQDKHVFMHIDEAIEFFNEFNKQELSYALPPVKIR